MGTTSIREGRWEAMNHILVILSREQDGRDATPSVGIIDSQSVKTAENGGPRGYDAGKKIRGRKRHIATDTLGHVVVAVVHPADVQDRDGGPLVAVRIRSLFPWLRHLIGDGDTLARSCVVRWLNSADGRSRSSNVAIGPKASSSCPNAGSWSVALHASDAAVASDIR